MRTNTLVANIVTGRIVLASLCQTSQEVDEAIARIEKLVGPIPNKRITYDHQVTVLPNGTFLQIFPLGDAPVSKHELVEPKNTTYS
jgi:hypothetical protein